MVSRMHAHTGDADAQAELTGAMSWLRYVDFQIDIREGTRGASRIFVRIEPIRLPGQAPSVPRTHVVCLGNAGRSRHPAFGTFGSMKKLGVSCAPQWSKNALGF